MMVITTVIAEVTMTIVTFEWDQAVLLLSFCAVDEVLGGQLKRALGRRQQRCNSCIRFHRRNG